MPELLERRGDESAADLIDQIERRSREIESTRFARAKTGRARIAILAVGIVASSAFLAWDLNGRTEPPPPFDAPAVRAGLEFTVFVTATGIEEHRTRTGTLPTTLAQVGLDHPSVTYTVESGAYRLVAETGIHRVTFDQGDDLEPFQESYWTLQRRGTP